MQLDTGCTAGQCNHIEQFFGELAKIPNRPTIPSSGSTSLLVAQINNPEALRNLLRLGIVQK